MTTRGMMKLLVLFASLCLVFTSPAWSQLTTAGAINGTVTDSSGAVVPGAAITITSEATQREIHTESNGDGSFVVPALSPGHYKIAITKDQFQTYTETGINLNAAQTVTVRAALTVGQTTATVTVQASAVQVQTSTPEVSNLVNTAQIGILPLNGRNYQSLSFLMPGVTNLSPDAAATPNGNNLNSVNGGGVEGTMFYVDGIWNDNSSNFKNTRVTPNPDSIQEVRLLQNNYGTEYNLNGYTTMLVETKSGTSTFHGTAFEYFRNNDLNARNYFTGTTPLKQNIFGFTVGGPFYIPDHYNTDKSKTFFFVSEQWIRRLNGNSVRTTVPTEAELGGLFPVGEPINDPSTGLPFPGNQIPVGRLNAAALSYLHTGIPLPNTAPLNVNTQFGNYINNLPVIDDERDDIYKGDQIIGTKLKLMGEYLATHETTNYPYQPQGNIYFPSTHELAVFPSQLAQVQLAQILSPSMVNTTSFSFSQTINAINTTGLEFQSQVPNFNGVLPYPITPRAGQPADRLPYIGFGGGYPTLGYLYIFPVFHAASGEKSLSDNWSWLRGKHYLRAGFQWVEGFERQTAFSPTAAQWIFAGNHSGNALADFLLGDASQLSQTNNEFRAHLTYPIVSPYISDQWKATRRLTVTGGIRYAYEPNPSFQIPGLYSNFVPSLYNPAEAPTVSTGGVLTPTPNYNPNNGVVILGTPGTPLNYTNKYKNYWSPTVGFAYDVFGDGKTSIRGGYGITHVASLPFACTYTCLNNPPNIQTATLTNPGFPGGFPDSLGGAPAAKSPLSFTAESTDLKEPTSQTYSLGVERQFGEWFVSVTGAGQITKHNPIMPNINQPPPEGGFDYNPLITTSTSGVRYASTIAGPTPFIGLGAVSYVYNAAWANWNALEVNVKHPVGHGVFFSAAYTWQHGLSTNRGTYGTSTVGQGSAGVQNVYDVGADYGTSNTNVGQVLSISAIWNIPLFRNSKGIERTLLGGWSYADITTIQQGFNLDPALGTSTPGLSIRPDRVAGTSIAGPKTTAEWFNTAAFVAPPAGFFGNATVGTILGPALVNFDMALYKDFAITERQKFQFRAEFFNIFNHTNFAGVSTGLTNSANGIFSGTYGQITSARDPRIMEFALRYEF